VPRSIYAAVCFTLNEMVAARREIRTRGWWDIGIEPGGCGYGECLGRRAGGVGWVLL
jgi:hypothetical protein